MTMYSRFTDGDEVFQGELNNMIRGAESNGVIKGLDVTEKGAGANMSVDVAAGRWVALGVPRRKAATTNVVIDAADGTNPRLDLIYADDAGDILELAGTPAAFPIPPTLPADAIALAYVSIPANDTTIEDAQISDLRVHVTPMIRTSDRGEGVDLETAIGYINNIAGGGVIYDTGGTYNWSAKVVVDHPLVIVGAGREATIIKAAGAKNYALFEIDNQAYCHFSHMTIDGDGGSGSQYGFDLGTGGSDAYVYFEDILFKSLASHSIYCSGNGWRGTMHHCQGGSIDLANNTEDSTIVASGPFTTMDTGSSLRMIGVECTTVAITGSKNKISDCESTDITITGSDNVVVGNRIVPTTFGIRVNGAYSNNVIIGNIINGSPTTSGIRIVDGTENIVIGNNIDINTGNAYDETSSADDNIWIGNFDNGRPVSIIGASSIHVDASSPSAATTTVSGLVELATTAEVNTGTDTARAICPDALAGSNLGEKAVCLVSFESDEAVTTGDGTIGFCVPSSMNGMNIVDATAANDDKGVTGATNVQVRRRRDGSDADVLDTLITLGDEWSVSDGVVDTANDDLATGDILYVDVDAIHSGTAPNGLSTVIVARLP